MRFIAVIGFSMASLLTGCAGSDSQAPRAPGATPEREADRVLAIAQDLEKRGDTKKAFASYHQIIRNFPETPSGRKAVQRIKEAQTEATRKPRTWRK